MSEPIEPTENASPRCPECGGDATRVRDRHPFTGYGSRAVLWAIFAILGASYLGLVVYFSSWSTNTQSFTSYPDTQSGSRRTLVIKGKVDQDVSSTEELPMAIEGNDALLDRITEQLRNAMNGESYLGPTYRVGRLRLEYWPLESWHSRSKTFSFLGRHYTSSLTTNYADIRTRELIEIMPGQDRITYIHWWPTLHIQRELAGGRFILTRSFKYLSILGLLTVLVWLSMFVRVLVTRSSRFRDRPRRVFWLTLIALSLSAAGVSFAMSETVISEQSASFQPIAEGPWFEVSDITAALGSPQQTRALLRSMSETMEFDRVVPYAVSFGREFIETESDAARAAEQPRLIETRIVGWTLRSTQLAPRVSLFHIASLLYDEPRTPQQIKEQDQAASWKDQVRGGTLRFTVNSPDASKRISIGVVNIALLVGGLWWLWLILSAIHRFRIGSLQRKRVNRNQCIFCAYPLSPEALAARSGGSGS